MIDADGAEYETLTMVAVVTKAPLLLGGCRYGTSAYRR